MLYAKRSLNYLLSISVLRRLGLALLYALRIKAGGIYAEHLANARNVGFRRYLSMKNFIHVSTDGPFNPYSKVYDLAGVRRDFQDFEIVRSNKFFMHAPPLNVKWLPFADLWGWHLWVNMKPKNF